MSAPAVMEAKSATAHVKPSMRGATGQRSYMLHIGLLQAKLPSVLAVAYLGTG